jgi:hypothetical protein
MTFALFRHVQRDATRRSGLSRSSRAGEKPFAELRFTFFPTETEKGPKVEAVYSQERQEVVGQGQR